MEKSTKIMIGVGIAAAVASIGAFLWWKNKQVPTNAQPSIPVSEETKPSGSPTVNNDAEVADLKSKYTSLNSKLTSLLKAGQGEILKSGSYTEGSPEYQSIKGVELPKIRKRLAELGWEAISSQQKDGSFVDSFRPYVKRTFKK